MTVLGTIRVTVTYAGGHQTQLEFSLEPDVCLGAGNHWYPGVLFHGSQYDAMPEVIAYAINEGQVTSGCVEGDAEDEILAQWRVVDDTLLRQYGVTQQ